jgi:hypothetical protein
MISVEPFVHGWDSHFPSQCLTLEVVILLLLLQPILIAAKLDQTLAKQGGLLTTSWFAIFIPCTCYIVV